VRVSLGWPPPRTNGSELRQDTPRSSIATPRHDRSARVALAIGPALLVLIVGTLAFDGVRRAAETRALVTHSRDVIDRAQATLSTLQDAETGQRGYLITSEERYLEPYARAVAAIRDDTTALRALTRSTPRADARLNSLDALIGVKMGELDETIRLRKDGRVDSVIAVVRTDRGKRAMDAIRLVLGGVTADERSVLDQRQKDEALRGRTDTVILVIGTFAAVLLALFLNATLLRDAHANAMLAGTLRERNAELEELGIELEFQAQQLQEHASDVEISNVQLLQANTALEAAGQRLQDQAAELEVQTEELEENNRALGEQTHRAEMARSAAEAANKAKSDFLAMMSHELRTPLNAIAGYAQLMQMGVPEPVPDAHQDYLVRIQQSQLHLLGVINSVLNFARVEAGMVSYSLSDVAVGTLLASVEPLIAPQVKARGHAYRCLPCERGLIVRADPDKVTQILLNLLSNASKFTPLGGQITLSADAATDDGGDVAVIRVRDTGIGIPHEKASSIFDPFVQVDTSYTSRTEGTGLGLSISRNLARGMGGDLTYRSEIEGGSTFILTLPLAATD
jgi:signal transduction histidine kinase